jgi:hypothetical protein
MSGMGQKQLLVFISHASEDEAAARRLTKRLREDGFNPWLDLERLLPGQDWSFEIEQALRTSGAILLCFSDVAVKKEGYIQREYKRAMKYREEKPEGTIFVIPVRLDECEMPHFIRELQWVDYSKDYEKLVAALNLRAGRQAMIEKPKGKKKPESKKSAVPKKSGGTNITVHGNINVGRDFVSGDKVNTITTINNTLAPAEFVAELQKLKAEIEALKSRPNVEPAVERILSTVDGNLQDAIEEAGKEKPAVERIKTTLEGAKEMMDKLGGGIASAVKLGTALGNLALMVWQVFGR